LLCCCKALSDAQLSSDIREYFGDELGTYCTVLVPVLELSFTEIIDIVLSLSKPKGSQQSHRLMLRTQSLPIFVHQAGLRPPTNHQHPKQVKKDHSKVKG